MEYMLGWKIYWWLQRKLQLREKDREACGSVTEKLGKVFNLYGRVEYSGVKLR